MTQEQKDGIDHNLRLLRKWREQPYLPQGLLDKNLFDLMVDFVESLYKNQSFYEELLFKSIKNLADFSLRLKGGEPLERCEIENIITNMLGDFNKAMISFLIEKGEK